jgi:hypothetical protein
VDRAAGEVHVGRRVSSGIVAADGEILARRPPKDGAGIVMADLSIAEPPNPSEALPERFWLPEDMPQPWQDTWEHWFPRGEDDYRTVTLPYLETGQQPE